MTTADTIQPTTDPRPLPLPVDIAYPPNRSPTIWLLIALTFAVWAVCVLSGA